MTLNRTSGCAASRTTYAGKAVMAFLFSLPLCITAAAQEGETASMNTSEILSYAEAAARYPLPYTLDDDWTFVVYPGTLEVSRHLLLDWSREGTLTEDEAVLLRDLLGDATLPSPYGVIVDGDLKVNGSILNMNYDGGPALVVTGETQAHSLLAGGSFMRFAGKADFSEAIYADYNHGETVFSGPVSAKILVSSDHALSLSDASRRSNIEVYINDTDYSGDGTEYIDLDDMPDEAAGILNPDIKTLGQIREALEKGQSLLR